MERVRLTCGHEVDRDGPDLITHTGRDWHCRTCDRILQEAGREDDPRPPVPHMPVPRGHEWVAVPELDPDWRMLRPDEDRLGCRYTIGPGHRQCRTPAVAVLMRGHPPRKRPWQYCDRHLYGRWIEKGRIMRWVLQEVAK